MDERFDQRRTVVFERVPEHNDFYRAGSTMEFQQITKQHRDASVAGHRDNLSIRRGKLSADCLRQSIRHGAVREGSQANGACHSSLNSATPR